MTRRLQVGMNLLWLRPGIVGGSEVAAVGTAEALATYAEEVAVGLYAQRSLRDTYPDLTGALRTETIGVPFESVAARAALESSWLPLRARRDHLEVLHCYGGVVPEGPLPPVVLTLHDVQPLEAVSRYNESNFSSTKRRWLKLMIPRSVARADVVLVPSESVRRHLLGLVDVEASKIVTLHHGCSIDATRRDRFDREEIRTRFGLPGPYVLYPAITYEHKNHRVLIDAFASLVDDRPDVRLVLTGGVGPAEADVLSAVEDHGLGAVVRRVGRVSSEELRALVRNAAVLAFPSRYEGFGLPVVEAFALGTPVVASTAGSLPEVVGDAGMLIDPDDVEAWSLALAEHLDGGEESPEVRRTRVDRAARFRWTDIAGELVGIYRRVAEESR